MAKLVVLSEGLAGKSHELKVDKTTVGRVDDNTFPLAEPSVSSHHCEIFIRGQEVVVRDLNSTNGTYINGQRVSEAPLKPGQILRLGQIELRLENGEGAPVAKKGTEQTRVLTRGGVRRNDLEQGTRSVKFAKDSPFVKKSNKAAKVTIIIGAVLVVIIVISLVIAYSKIGK